jgi:hypothetical protein
MPCHSRAGERRYSAGSLLVSLLSEACHATAGRVNIPLPFVGLTSYFGVKIRLAASQMLPREITASNKPAYSRVYAFRFAVNYKAQRFPESGPWKGRLFV